MHWLASDSLRQWPICMPCSCSVTTTSTTTSGTSYSSTTALTASCTSSIYPGFQMVLNCWTYNQSECVLSALHSACQPPGSLLVPLLQAPGTPLHTLSPVPAMHARPIL